MKTQLFISFSTFPTSCVRHSRHEADNNRGQNTTKNLKYIKDNFSFILFYKLRSLNFLWFNVASEKRNSCSTDTLIERNRLHVCLLSNLACDRN